MLRTFGAILLISVTAAHAARIDDGPLPNIDRQIQGCWINAEGTLAQQIAAAGDATTLELCFAEGTVDTALTDAAGERVGGARGVYSFRNEKIVLTSDAGWIFGRSTLICDIGVKPYVRLGLFDCVGSGDGEPVVFFDDLLFLAPPKAAT